MVIHDYDFVPMNEEYARRIVDNWKYGAEYAIHDYSNEADHILDSKSWGKGLFAVLNEDKELVGELTTEFFDENDDYIAYADFSDERLSGAEMWIGFGLKPELTGRGLGLEERHTLCQEPSTRWRKSLSSLRALAQFLRSPGIVRSRLYVAKIGCKMIKTTPQTGI